MSTPHEEGESLFTSKRFKYAGGFLAAVLVIAVAAMFFGGRASDTPPAAQNISAPPVASTPPAAAEPTNAVTTAPQTDIDPATSTIATPTHEPVPVTDVDLPGDPSVCGLPAGDQSIPLVPPSATWQIVGNRIAAPSSPTYGPGTTANGIGDCYAHSPTGALFAMMNSVALTGAASDQISQVSIVTQRGSRTNLYDAALAEAKAEDAKSAMPSESSTQVKQAILGYTYVDYTPERATIAVAVGIGDPTRPSTYQPSMMTGIVVWEGGDWKFVYSAQTANSMAPIVSSLQYTAWGA